MARDLSAAHIAAVGLSGFGIWQLSGLYNDMAPNLGDLRKASPDDPTMNAQLQDANLTTGVMALLAGVLASYMAGTYLPLLVIGSVWATLALMHHRVLKGEAK